MFFKNKFSFRPGVLPHGCQTHVKYQKVAALQNTLHKKAVQKSIKTHYPSAKPDKKPSSILNPWQAPKNNMVSLRSTR